MCLHAGPAQGGRGPFIEEGEALVMGQAIEIGAITQLGMGEFSSTINGVAPSAHGVVLRDRNGVSSRLVFGLLTAVAGALEESGPKSVESKRYRVGNYMVTETTTTYYSEAEKAAIRAKTNSAINGIFSSENADFELQVFARDRFGYGDSSGHKASFMLGGTTGIGSLVFEAGFGWGDVNSVVVKDGVTHELDHKYLGMPFRLSGGFRPLRWALTWEWNWLAHALDEDEREPTPDPMNAALVRTQLAHHPLHLDLQAAVFGRVFLAGGATVPSIRNIKSGDVGLRASLGLRF